MLFTSHNTIAYIRKWVVQTVLWNVSLHHKHTFKILLHPPFYCHICWSWKYGCYKIASSYSKQKSDVINAFVYLMSNNSLFPRWTHNFSLGDFPQTNPSSQELMCFEGVVVFHTLLLLLRGESSNIYYCATPTPLPSSLSLSLFTLFAQNDLIAIPRYTHAGMQSFCPNGWKKRERR